jgi:NAD(P)H dehydrogenase (quinone)
VKVLIIFDTRYGNVHRLADAVAEGARQVEGAEAVLRRVEIVEPEAVIQQNERWREANERFRAVPQVTVEEMIEADAIAFGTPTRFGSMTAPMKKLFDSLGGPWAEGKFYGKVGAAFCSTGTPHGGTEMTLISMFIPMYHLGMIVVTPGYGDPSLFEAGSPYGAVSVSGPMSDQPPTENDLAVARFHGRRIAEVARALARSDA